MSDSDCVGGSQILMGVNTMKAIDYLGEELKLQEYRKECTANNVEPVIDLLAGE